MDKVLNEIDQELLEFPNRPRRSILANRKRLASPLIFAPPVVKSIEEKKTAEVEIVEIEEETFSEKYELDGFEASSQKSFYDKESSEHDTNEDEESSDIPESSELLHEGVAESPELLYNYEDSLEKEWINEDIGETEKGSQEVFLTIRDNEKRHLKDHQYTPATRVKIPVHLSRLDFEIDVFDTLNLSRPIYYISKIEWSLYSIKAQVLSPSSNVFVKGIFILDIEYLSRNVGTIHSLKIHVPWQKLMLVEWFHKPEISWKKSDEYTFMNNTGNEVGFQRGYQESLVEKIDFNLKSFKCTWKEQLINEGKLLIQGTANVEIDLYQKQCVNLSRVLNHKK